MDSELEKDLNILRNKYPKYYFKATDKKKAISYQNKYYKIKAPHIIERIKQYNKKKLYDCHMCLKHKMSYNTMYKHIKSQKHLRSIREADGLSLGL